MPPFLYLISMEKYTGQKGINGVFEAIMNVIPEFEIFIDVFAGSGVIANCIKGIDNNSDVRPNDLNPECVKFLRADLVQSFTTVPAVQLIKEYTCRDHVLFLDPPYMHETRPAGTDIYGKFEMLDNDHIQLLLTVLQSNAKIIIIHPDCETYNSYLSEWYKKDVYIRYNTKTSHEVIYTNFNPEAERLFTYDYVGFDCWERQRIKRKTQRLIDKLSDLPFHEREAIIRSIQERFC